MVRWDAAIAADSLSCEKRESFNPKIVNQGNKQKTQIFY